MTDQIYIKKHGVYLDDYKKPESLPSPPRKILCKIPMPVYACVLVFCMVICIGSIIAIPLFFFTLAQDRNMTTS